MGNNKRRLLVLANSNDIPKHLALLKKIARAISFDFESDLWFGTMTDDERFRMLSSDLTESVDTIMLFGIAPTHIGLQVHSAQRVLRFDTFRVLLAPSLAVIAEDESQKRALWAMLKEAFAI